jgi:hypothetical protein
MQVLLTLKYPVWNKRKYITVSEERWLEIFNKLKIALTISDNEKHDLAPSYGKEMLNCSNVIILA